MRKLTFLMISAVFGTAVHSQSWNLTGNTGTSDTNFVGTRDAHSLLFKVNNIKAGLIHPYTYNTSFGLGSLGNGLEGNYNTAIGHVALALNMGGSGNTATGASALTANSNGFNNTAAGAFALGSTTTGSSNSAQGYAALYSNTTGGYNTANGIYALYYNNTSWYNTATGSYALFYNTGGQNSAHGYKTLYSNTTGGANTASGWNCMISNTTGWNNTASGMAALQQNSTGSGNTAFGVNALESNVASFNTAVGAGALSSNGSSQYNTAIGYMAGSVYMGAYPGWNNTMLGARSAPNSPDRYNCIAIGYSAINTASNQARIGNTSTTSIGGYVGWSNISDGRFKKDVEQNVKGLDFILKLQPVTYHLDIQGLTRKLDKDRGAETDPYTIKGIREKEKIMYSGFIAQDVERAAKESAYEFSGIDKPQDANDLYGLRYGEFVVPLVKGMQEQQALLEQQAAMINELIKQNADLRSRLTIIEAKNGIATPITSNDALSVRPNPGFDKIFVSIICETESHGVLNLFDNRGALVREQRIKVVPGANQLSMDISTVAKGIYVLSAEWNNGQIKRTGRVVKQ